MEKIERVRVGAGTVLRAMVVIVCYLIVFAGLVLTVAGAGTPP